MESVNEILNSLDKRNTTKLDFSDKELDEFPIQALEFVNLEELHLNCDFFISIPKEIKRLDKLKKFSLTRKQVLGSQKIKELTVEQENNLEGYSTTFPGSICNLSNLEELKISQYEFQNVPKSIQKLTNLRILDLSNNAFVKFPETICRLNNLQKLNLELNYLTELTKLH